MIDDGAARRIYFDTNIFLVAFESATEVSRGLASIFDHLRRRPQHAVTSEITLAELLGKESPVLGWTRQSRLYVDLLVFSNFIDLRPVSRDILVATGDYQRAARASGRKVGLPDAIHVVTAVKAGCRYVFTADKRLAIPKPLETVVLGPNSADAIEQILDA